MIRQILLPTTLLISSFLFSQKTIEIRQSGTFTKNEKKYPNANILSKKDSKRVHLYHEGVLIISDTSIFYPKRNFFLAKGDVYLNQGDSITISSEYLEYDGISKKSIAWGNAIITRPDMTLTTDTIELDREINEFFYNTKGTVVDSTTVLISDKGRYFIDEKKYRFKTNVIMEHPDYTMTSDSLDYFTERDETFIYGDTKIKGDDYDIIAKRGYYHTEIKQGYFTDDATIFYDNKIIKGDSLFFDSESEYAAATTNASILDTINDSFIRGDFAEIFKAKDSAIITKNAYVANVIEKDSLFIKADTLIATGPEDHRIVRGYYNVKVFKSDIQGKADSVYINEETGLTKLLRIGFTEREKQIFTNEDINQRNPILWVGKNQMTGDVIHLISNKETKTLDTLYIPTNSFIIEKDTLSDDGYNQIKGEILIGTLSANKLTKLEIEKNNKVVFYLYDDKDELIGIDKTLASKMEVYLEKNKIKEVLFLVSPNGDIFPENDLDDNEKRLKGFIWREKERPLSKEDLFREIVIDTIKTTKDTLSIKKYLQ